MEHEQQFQELLQTTENADIIQNIKAYADISFLSIAIIKKVSQSLSLSLCIEILHFSLRA